MKNGPYELITAPPGYPGKLYRGKYAYEHRVNWWRETGQNPDGVLIHHKDEKKRNNSVANLQSMRRPEHTAHHARPTVYLKHVCENCGCEFERRQSRKPRFCSRRCIGLYHGCRRRK